jgi:hypothetical protein
VKTLHLAVITGIGITTFVVIGIFLLFTSPQIIPSIKGDLGCKTMIKVIYAEPAKYNQTIILNALRDNLSKDNFRDYHGPNPWWQSAIIQTIDPHVFYIVIPSVDGKTINMTKTIISKIDGVGKSLSSKTECPP